MKSVWLIIVALLVGSQMTYGQTTVDDSTTITYEIELAGSAATGDLTPFWTTSNRWGVVPAESGNLFLRPQIKHQQLFGKGFYWTNHIDAVVVTPRYRNIYLQQLYTELGYKKLSLRIGSKQEYSSLWDKDLSTGDLILSSNARPVPEINISLTDFVPIPFSMQRLHIKGNVAFGRSFETAFLEQSIDAERFDYIKNVLWHHKSFHLRFKDAKGEIPFYATAGLRHIAQWGGTSTNENLGKQPQSLKDMVRIFFLKSGGEGASLSDQINVLGSHHVSYDFQVGYEKETWGIQAYYQHLSYDKSGILFYNKTDGLWGLQLDLPTFPWLKSVVLEYMNTKNQSGPLHYIDFDHDAHPGRGGGNDCYYNNGEYTTGNSYFARGTGSPLLPSPVYNQNGIPGFLCTRVEDLHIGAKGSLLPTLDYRAMFTVMKGWGTHKAPFLEMKQGCSFLVEIDYRHPRWAGWSLCGLLAGDTGDMFGKQSYGFSLGIRKAGIIR
ncbi:hypothetical protein M2480_000025 [Parabacteroides sp. PFB2-12]|uniref:capsule assembly Wzi family protein n=1 Tax=unclassified Parabacteroides TaxID=2649774 RepID=UPI0024732D6F|nr:MULTISPECIES: capsule assembly Wzi family protein [unclassified Parabacteroides]MDH6341275.1 hypothetical protein [Parabacteroides sp. PM6-13]MDH6389067.1 hypothetical protein [Parabacteroides sp. PFB2-12]